MRKIFDGNYTRFDDDVSFQILRTNPRLTTNTKLMYDGEDLYLESYNANSLLSTQEYKGKRVWKNNLFNNDLKNFLHNTGESAYDIFHELDNTIVGDSFDNQFENTYWCGCESIKSNIYPQEMGIIAPLYIRKKLPNYFVIFKIEDASNYNMHYNGNENSDKIFIDDDFNFSEDVINKSKIIKAFSLKQGTPLGDYIRKYVSQLTFKYDQPIHVNFSSKDITYYGIDKYSGVLTSKVENFEKELLNNDNTILHSDDWITNGFVRNNLIYPYIMNIEFLFDDKESEEYKIHRYMGYYCNDIDLYEYEDCELSDKFVISNECTFYLKDKYDDLYTLKNNLFRNKILNDVQFTNSVGFKVDYKLYTEKNEFDSDSDSDDFYYNYYRVTFNYMSIFDEKGNVNVDGRKIDIDNITGYDNETIKAYCDYIDGIGKSTFVFRVDKPFKHGDTIKIYNEDKISESESNDYENYKIAEFTAEQFYYDGFNKYKELEAGTNRKDKFSCNGSVNDIAKSICESINSLDWNDKYITAYCLNNIVVLKYVFKGEKYNNKLKISFSDSLIYNNNVYIPSEDYYFNGGTDIEGCLFKIRKDDLPLFIGEKNRRYIKTPDGYDNAKITSFIPFINEFDEIDDEYYIISTDKNGIYIKISDVKQVELVDVFYPIVGMLSYLPIKDFDFDTVYSDYGNNSCFENECKKNNFDNMIKTHRFVDYMSNKIETEYDYYYENLLPKLCTYSKTVPYIAKWSYVDSVDSCENPYRLNASKIFGTSNFSSNTFVVGADNTEYTHDMPYYLIYDKNVDLSNEYQYVYNCFEESNEVSSINYKINYLESLFKRTDENNFDKLFSNTSDKKYNKKHKQKYSIFKYGNNYTNPSTLFRGVKFNIIEQEIVDSNKNIYRDKVSGKYNDYKFSFIYIPIKMSGFNIYFNNKVYFVKNDKFKFIVGFILFNELDKFVNNEKITFNKSYVYGGCKNLIKINYNSNEIENIFSIKNNITLNNINIDDIFDYSSEQNKSIILLDKMKINFPSLKHILLNVEKYNNDGKSSINLIKFYLNNELYVSYKNEDLTFKDGCLYIKNEFKGTRIFNPKYKSIKVSIEININNNGNDEFYEKIFGDYMTIFETMSSHEIKENINSNSNNIKYLEDERTFRIEIEEPTSITSCDYFTSKLVNSDDLQTNTSLPTKYIKIVDKQKKDMSLRILSRYSGYYEPIFKDIVFYKDVNLDRYECSFSNTIFDYEYEDFGIIKNMFFHKINDDNSNNIVTSLNPYNPISGQYALDYKDYNIYSTNWDMGYFTKQLDIYNNESCKYIGGMKDELCMFGSKYMNVPDEIYIDVFNGCSEWNAEYINNQELCENEIMYYEKDNYTVEFYLFLRKRIARYFCELKEIRDEIEHYITKEYSFGSKETIDDDIIEYVEKNIIDLYKIESIYVWIRQTKSSLNNNRIENDYINYVNMNSNDLIYNGFKKVNKINIRKISTDWFDRKITYNLNDGIKEDFAFSFKIKRI